MNVVDLLIILVIAFFAVEGQKRGFLTQLFDVIGFLVSLTFSLILYTLPAQLLVGLLNVPKVAANPAGFLIVWLISETLFFTAFASLFKKIIAKHHESKVNKFLGFAPAALNALLFLSFALLFVVSLPINPNTKKLVFDSKIGAQLVDKATILERPFNNIFGPFAKQSLTFLTIKPGETETVQLGYTQQNHTVIAKEEQQMLALVNTERQKRGFAPLFL